MAILGEQFLHVLVDSKKRLTGTTSNFTFKIDFPADQQYNRVVVQQVLIPQTFYLFQEGTNTFILDVGGVQFTIIIPVGNYNYKTFATVISELLTETNDKQYSYTCLYTDGVAGASTNKYVFNISPAPNETITFIFTSIKPAEVMGFDTTRIAGQSVASLHDAIPSAVFDGPKLYPPFCYNFAVEQSFLILTDMVTNNVLIEMLDVGIGLGSISFTSNSLDSYSRYYNKVASNANTFTLTNEDYTVIDLKGANMLFSLLFYRSDDTNILTRQSMMLKHLDKLSV